MCFNLFNQLRKLELPLKDYAVFGSGPLAIRGIITSCNDLDVLCRRDAWNAVTQIGTKKILPEYNVTVVVLSGGMITFGREWGIGNYDVDDLIDTAEVIDALPFVQLKHVVSYKKIRSSSKDLLHLEAMEAWSRRQ